jgi:hypothetical protein
MTKLSHVEIRPHFDQKIPLVAYFGDQRVVYEIPYKALDDSFPGGPHLTDEQRVALVNSNVEDAMQALCERGAWRRTNRGAGWFWLLDFNAGDLKFNDRQHSVREKSAEREGA